ncbi:hypothetical protein GGS26DRAFT_174029 [Hypomontagnella submonticulosa]|nr:hypothetical protein GGS26DRAFT_174029 [Hypomontagnella submonticulosa]
MGRDLTPGWFDASYLLRKGVHDATPTPSSLWSLHGGQELILKGVIISSIPQHTEPFQFIGDGAIKICDTTSRYLRTILKLSKNITSRTIRYLRAFTNRIRAIQMHLVQYLCLI